ncbi:MAG: hypothetical protein AAFY11_03910 [Cyanobacteria bacterium J06641_5]
MFGLPADRSAYLLLGMFGGNQHLLEPDTQLAKQPSRQQQIFPQTRSGRSSEQAPTIATCDREIKKNQNLRNFQQAAATFILVPVSNSVRNWLPLGFM